MLVYYITYAILALLVIGLGFVIAKKNELTSNKPLIIYIITCVLLLTLPALLAILNYSFMPYGYLVSGAIYLILGYLNRKVLKWLFKKSPDFGIEFSIYMLTGIMAAICYSLLFNYLNELDYGVWASSTLLFYLLPGLYIKTNELFHSIPLEIYKIWSISKSIQSENESTIDYSKLKVVKIELFKQEADAKPVTIDAKAPNEMLFGSWFKRLLTDYNKKSPLTPIDIHNQSEDAGWIFYYKPSFLFPRKYIDYEKNFRENRIGERYTIIAKRVKEIINTGI